MCDPSRECCLLNSVLGDAGQMNEEDEFPLIENVAVRLEIGLDFVEHLGVLLNLVSRGRARKDCKRAQLHHRIFDPKYRNRDQVEVA